MGRGPCKNNDKTNKKEVRPNLCEKVIAILTGKTPNKDFNLYIKFLLLNFRQNSTYYKSLYPPSQRIDLNNK